MTADVAEAWAEVFPVISADEIPGSKIHLSIVESEEDSMEHPVAEVVFNPVSPRDSESLDAVGVAEREEQRLRIDDEIWGNITFVFFAVLPIYGEDDRDVQVRNKVFNISNKRKNTADVTIGTITKSIILDRKEIVKQRVKIKFA